MIATSNIKPEAITPDWGSMISGVMDILVHWEIVEKIGINPDSSTYPYYEYQEEKIKIDVPNSDQETIKTYITANADRFHRMVGAPSPSDLQWKSDVEAALLDLAKV